MKKITLTILVVLSAAILFAQSPQSFKYQAIARDNVGNILANQNISFQISILQGSSSGTPVYVESHSATTNEIGLVNLEIGNGTIISGEFTVIEWGTDKYFIQIEMDESGGSTYQLMGVSQLLSVPYALHAETATNTDDGDWTKSGDNMYSSVSGNVGVGNNTPTYTLDVAGKIGIHDIQVLYLPDQATYVDNLVIGNGGNNLSFIGGYDAFGNTAVGIGAFRDNTTGNSNTFIGHIAGQENTTGYENTFVGWGAGKNNVAGNNNSFFGNGAGYFNTGSDNIIIGSGAGQGNSSGNKNIFIGVASGFSNGTADNNIFIGYSAGYNNSGYNNVFIGDQTGTSNENGGLNTYLGFQSGFSNVGGSNNTFLGSYAGSGSAGSGNVFIGSEAGKNELGDNKLYIENSNSSSPLIGGDFSVDEVYLNGDVGINTASPTAKLDVNGSSGFDQLRMRTSYTPTGTGDVNGNTGDIAWDDNYIYIKTSSGWKRVALGTW